MYYTSIYIRSYSLNSIHKQETLFITKTIQHIIIIYLTLFELKAIQDSYISLKLRKTLL